MPSRDPLPPEWVCLEGKVDYVVRRTATEYSSSCPACGDLGHTGRDWPDRCRLFIDNQHPRLFCRRCGLIGFPDEFDGTPPTHEELERWRQDRIRQEEARKRSAERALEHLRNEELWRKYHENLDEKARLFWQRRGIENWAIDWWQLGYCYDREFYSNGTPFRTDAAVIPIFGLNWEPRQVKVRLDWCPSGDKYRYLYPGVGQPLYLTNPEFPPAGNVIAIEGELKAAVTYLRYADEQANIVGLPGKHPSAEIVNTLSQCDRVTLVADPDAKREMVRLANKIGVKKCWLLSCPEKIDDAILKYEWSKNDVRRLIAGATRLADYL
jgi:hypothetical protein